jgi:squalene-hopene/tetraprenyl-beta-curcumene cyclase
MVELDSALSRALAALLSQRNSAGYWEGKLASSPLATALAIQSLGDDLPRTRRKDGCEYLIRTQHEDGGWGDTSDSRSNIAATALVLCADSAAERFLSREKRAAADQFLEKLGGLKAGLRAVYGKDLTFQVPIRMAAASAGMTAWRDVDALPFELALAPRRMMGALRLPVVSYALPALVCVGLSRHAKAPTRLLPLRWLRQALTEKALYAILHMQPQSGGYLEAIPITAFCLLGLQAADRQDHPVAQNARRFLLATQRSDGSWPVEVNLSVWNTTRAIDALAGAGLLESALSERERATTRDWLLAQQAQARSVYSDTQPGGWGWNHLSGSVPDADDTSGAILALQHLGVSAEHPALVQGRRWLLNLQNANGGWPTFCRGWEKLPFDRSAPDLTAHALRALAGAPAMQSAVGRGWRYLKEAQRPDGSFAPLWFGCESAADQVNYTYGTTHVLLAGENGELGARAAKYMASIQNGDGSFGGCAGGTASAEETGLALRALSGSSSRPENLARAAQWLAEHQRADGSWDASPIGFYFAVLWYSEDLYPLYYALGGLGAYARVAREAKTRHLASAAV